MTFQKSVEETRHLKGAWRAGLGALRAEDKPRIQARDTRRLRGSVDVDAALVHIEPHANRWDFAIGYQHTNREDEFIYWVEIHTGSDAEIKVVRKKMEWLKSWLHGDGQKLAMFERDIVWVASRATSFTKGATQVKILASLGLRYSGGPLCIPSAHPDPPPPK